MKYITSTLLSFLFLCPFLNAQDCPPGDVSLNTQAEVDAFVANYPNCTMINGSLCICEAIGETDVITDISGLSMLTHIAGNLAIDHIHTLLSLNGLEQLEEISGDLRFDGLWDRATALDISALDHAITIDGIVYLGDIVSPFAQISPCGVQAICDHYFLSSGNITDIYDTCTSLSLVCQNPPTDCPTSDVTIESQAQADNFIQLYPNCTELNVSLIFNASEQELNVSTGFANIEKITGNISARACEVSGTFMALDTLWGSISAQVGAGVNNTYADGRMGAAFPNLKYISETLEAYYNPEGYTSVSCSLPELTRIEGGFDACNRGVSCVDCVNLEYIGGDIFAHVGGLVHVDTIMGTIDYNSCPDAFDNTLSAPAGGFDELKYLGGSLIIGGSQLQSFGDITGYQQLNTIEGSFYCFNDFNYTGNDYEVTGLGELKHVESISINYYRLGNLDFLSQLESIDGGLSLVANNRLTDISGLDHAVDIGGELYFKDNPQLSECAVQAVCNHINANGFATIENNMTGCNSVDEVQALCPSGDCLPDGITFSSQAEIDNFPTNYPNCIVIQGEVIIEEAVSGDITNLDGLAQVRIIDGGLTIQNNTALPVLNGLHNLNEIVGAIVIQNNGALSELSALSDLTYYTSITDLQILNNNSLTECAITSICNYFIVGGTATVSNNATGCDTVAEITDACVPGCPPEGVTIRDQQDIETYFLAYPGCTQINGSMYIGSSNYNDIHDLNGLSNIESISGSLTLNFIQDLSSLEGLNNLQQVAGSLSIRNCDGLSDISALSNLHTVGGVNVIIERNDILPNLYGLHNLTDFSGSCSIELNDSLTALSDFGNFNTMNSLFIINNDALTDLDGFQTLDTLTGTLDIKQNNSLTTLSGLGELKTAGSIFIEDSPNLINLALNSLENINGLFFIIRNSDLTNFNGLEALRNVEQTFKVEGNSDLVNFEGLNSLESVGYAFEVISNWALDNFEGLDALNTIGSLVVQENLTMTSLQGIQNLENIGTTLFISTNNALTNLDGLQGVLTVGQDVIVNQNSSLINFEGLNNLQSIEGNLEALSNPALVNFEGLETLNYLEDYLIIDNNNSLESLEGLESLEHVSRVEVLGNDNINTLNGIQNIDHENLWAVTLTDNPNLSQCAVESVCNHLADGSFAIIANNAVDCNSVEEVSNICIVPIHVPDDLPEITTVPNPNNGAFTVQGITSGTYDILNLTGEIIQSGNLKNNTSIDISSEAQGVYYILISIDNQVITKRIAKM